MSLFSSHNKLDVVLLTFVLNKYINLIINKSNSILLIFLAYREIGIEICLIWGLELWE